MLGLTVSILGHGTWRGVLEYSYLETSLLPWTVTSAKGFDWDFPEIKALFIKRHKLANHVRQAELLQFSTYYDESIADVDAQFGALYDKLNESGILDHVYLLVTSDHGELCECEEIGHVTPLHYDSVIHVPLLISAPQQGERRDFHTRTSNVDVLSILLSLEGGQATSSLDGKILPGFGGTEEADQGIFSVEAKANSAFGLLKRATVTLMKQNYKIIYYGDYPKYSNIFEFYDLEDDIDERNDLFADGPAAAILMKHERGSTRHTEHRK